jgi:hypothetical protein
MRPLRIAALLSLLSAPLLHAALPNCATGAIKNAPCEIQRVTSATYADQYLPYTSFSSVSATFTTAGRSITVRGFYDGLSGSNAIFKFRFTAPVTGTWNYTVTSSPADGGLTGGSSFTVNAGSGRGFLRRDTAFPTRMIFDNGTYPFVWGQTYYQLINNYSDPVPGTWSTAINNSMGKGMTKFRVLLYPWWGDDPTTGVEDNNGYGIYLDRQPYAAAGRVPTEAEYSKLNLAHWQKFDALLEDLNNRGAIVELILFHDTASGTTDPTPSRAFARIGGAVDTSSTGLNARYAQYAAARYAAYPNVYFCLSNEWTHALNNKPFWQMIGAAVRAADGFFYDPVLNRFRLLSIHNNTDRNFQYKTDIATAGAGWVGHSVVQYSFRNTDGNNQPDQWGNVSITSNLAANMPVFNDEFGYIHEQKPDLSFFEGTPHRQAMWGIAMAGGYGTVGDVNPLSGSSISLSSDWQSRTEYNDVKNLVDFFTLRITNFHRLVQASTAGIVSNQTTTVYALRQASIQFVFYKVASGTFRLTLPAGKTYTISKYDPVNGGALVFVQTLVGGTTSGDIGGSDAGDWVYVAK